MVELDINATNWKTHIERFPNNYAPLMEMWIYIEKLQSRIILLEKELGLNVAIK